MIIISQQNYNSILQHAIDGLPNEACGLIAGMIEDDKKYIKKVYLLTNIDASNEHFSIDPKEQLSTVKDIRYNNLILLGNFHSHPETPSRPSEEDIRLAFDSKASYLILSLQDKEKPVLKAFLINELKQVKEEVIQIEE
jgi:proteasome lid subunit RPN8/RPN11